MSSVNFSEILKSAEDVSDQSIENPVGYRVEKLKRIVASAKSVEDELRREMEKISLQDSLDIADPVGLYRISAIAENYSKSDLVAIDGTDTPLVSFIHGQDYECIVGALSYDSQVNPEVWRANPQNVQSSVEAHPKGVTGYIEDMDMETGKSWPNTFREYKERERGLLSSKPDVLIDGPVITQNLITQKEGIELLKKIHKSKKRYLGIIKDLSSSSPQERWYGRVLKEGEFFIVDKTSDLLRKRLTSAGGSKELKLFLSSTACHFCRGVYRPGNPITGSSPYFGFECRIKDVPWAMAVIQKESSDIIGHEIPILLDLVDGLIQRSHDRSAFKKSLEAEMAFLDPSQILDNAEERDFR